jgi:DNA-binding NtrC family response regulator
MRFSSSPPKSDSSINEVIKLTFKINTFLRITSYELSKDSLLKTILLETISAINATEGAIYLLQNDEFKTFGSIHKQSIKRKLVSSIEQFNGNAKLLLNERNLISAPIWQWGKIAGALLVKDRQFENGRGEFTLDDKALLIALADTASIVLEKNTIEEENRQLRSKFFDETSYTTIIVSTPAMKQLFYQIETIAKSEINVSVLIQGESGTGKELVAKIIHQKSSRRDKSFVAINCAAIPSELIESELFGHKKGAFTGAVQDRIGKFALSNGGILFLDEIGDMDLRLQAKLLRVLQDGTYQMVGGNETYKANFQLISATNKNLKEEVKAGKFREDLYYRLKTIELNIPPLRERLDDIPSLIQHFLSKLNQKNGTVKINAISPKALDVLRQYSWPGNVREMEQIITNAYIFCDTKVIDVKHLPKEIIKNTDNLSLTFTEILPLEIAIGNYIKFAYQKMGYHKVNTMKKLDIAFRRLQRYLGK